MPEGHRLNDVAAILAQVNQHHGMAWSLMRKLPGGYLEGAYELRGADDDRAVLKWYPRDLSARQLTDAAIAIERIRRRGWPTSRWLAYGSLADDGTYVIEEFIVGEIPRTLGAGGLAQLMHANSLQAGVRPTTDQNWSAYVYRVVFEGEADLAARLRGRSATARLLNRLERLTAEAKGVPLPDDDLVHGDFVLRNMIDREGDLYLVDAAHAGRGTRLYDLASLLLETTVEGMWVDGSLGPRLQAECVALAGFAALSVCVAGRMLHLLAFGEPWSDSELIPLVAACDRFVDDLERASTR